MPRKGANAVNIDEEESEKEKNKPQEVTEFKVPKFNDVVSYIWEQMQKRKQGSNAKHRFVINNQVLQFHPMTFHEVSVGSNILF